jgi:cation diffusion facilitator family transporter
LSKAAKKHNSQALEADALHFSTDIWSSTVVLIGLIFAHFGYFYADSIAALIVAVIVILVCYRLGKRSIDILLDKTPLDIKEKIEVLLYENKDIIRFHDLKVRSAGPDIFVELNIHVEPKISIEEAHRISHKVESNIKDKIGRCEVHVHIEPELVEFDS